MRRALAPLSWLYGAAVRMRNHRFDKGEAHKLPVPVISVGNLTTGGSGKTPLVAAIARELLSKGHRVAVLSRGYRRDNDKPFVLVSDGAREHATAFEAGDEPVELARTVPGLAVAVGADRYRVGLSLLEKLGPHLMLLDDGFQHRSLARDLDLLCFDASEPVGAWTLLPVGRLREPLGNAKRADAVIVTGRRDGPLPAEIAQRPSFRATTRISGFARCDEVAEPLLADAFHEVPVALAAGVARPERVRESLDATVVRTSYRRDHHRWRADEVEALMDASKGDGARALLVTGKDAVKMDGFSGSLPIYRIVVETQVKDRDDWSKLLAFPAL